MGPGALCERPQQTGFAIDRPMLDASAAYRPSRQATGYTRCDRCAGCLVFDHTAATAAAWAVFDADVVQGISSCTTGRAQRQVR